MNRRVFLGLARRLVDTATALLIAIPGAHFLIRRPVRQGRQETGFIDAVPLSALARGEPLRVTVSADRWDSFVRYPPGPIGSVWLMRESDEPLKVRAWQSICPHLGCVVDYAPNRREYVCPCHQSDFALDGSRLRGVSPRSMDELECRVTEPDQSGEQWVAVRYLEFEVGTARKLAT